MIASVPWTWPRGGGEWVGGSVEATVALGDVGALFRRLLSNGPLETSSGIVGRSLLREASDMPLCNSGGWSCP